MPWIRISFAEKAFLRLLASRGLSLESLTADQGIEAMREFHEQQRAQHTSHGGEDSLRYRRRGDSLVVTRRMVRAGESTGHELTLRIRPTGARIEFTAD